MPGMRGASFWLMAAQDFAYGRISLILLGLAPFTLETDFLD
jgi:hypothetical protein